MHETNQYMREYAYRPRFSLIAIFSTVVCTYFAIWFFQNAVPLDSRNWFVVVALVIGAIVSAFRVFIGIFEKRGTLRLTSHELIVSVPFRRTIETVKLAEIVEIGARKEGNGEPKWALAQRRCLDICYGDKMLTIFERYLSNDADLDEIYESLCVLKQKI
ncbi:MAG: hypothetical protein HY308_15470 [Gammaproteobacteria bacterium]|nr:hypothetical protein [Gammaproteobacteria bacterium]